MRLEEIENTILYFARTNMFSVLQMQRESADKAINGFNPDALLNTPTDDLVKKIVDTYKLDIPVLLRDDAHMDEPREIIITSRTMATPSSKPARSSCYTFPLQVMPGCFGFSRPATIPLRRAKSQWSGNGPENARH
jgi:hypothetical protein